MGRALYFLILFGLLGACQSNSIGQGPITFSWQVQDNIDRYMAEHGKVGYMAVAVDGISGSAYIPCDRDDCDLPSKEAVLQACEEDSGGVLCRIYAFEKEVIWQREKASNSVRVVTLFWAGQGVFSGQLQMDSANAEGMKFTLLSDDGGKQCEGTVPRMLTQDKYHLRWAAVCNNGRKLGGFVNRQPDGSHFGAGFDSAREKFSIEIARPIEAN